jgi:hypothetical protein
MSVEKPYHNQTETPLEPTFSPWAALLMNAALGIIVYRLAYLTGWYAIKKVDNNPDADVWLLTVILGTLAILAINILWLFRPGFQLACWRGATSHANYLIFPSILLITRIALELVHPHASAPWKEQVIWGSISESWWAFFYLFMGTGLYRLKRKFVDNDSWPWMGEAED